MRIRLDKLFLSAGLALAVIATTIPVIPTKAATTVDNYYVGTTEYSADYITRDLQTKEGDKSTDGSNITITAGALGVGVSSNSPVELGETANAKVTLYKSDNSFTGMDQITSIPSAITVSQPFTYALADVTVTVSADTNGTAAVEDNIETEADESVAAVAAVKTERDAAVDAIIAELNALGIGTFSKGEVTGPVAGIGSYTVDVSYATPTKATSTDYGSSTYSGVATLTLNVSAVNTETKKATIDLEGDTFVATRNYTITNLSAVGATYKIDEVIPAETAGKQYTLLKVSADGTIEEVKTVFGASEASNATADVTDLSCAYYLATKTVSTSDKLIFDDIDEDVVELVQVPEPTDEGKTEIAKCIESNSFTPVSYFTIDLVSGKTYSDTPITFKIAVPVDVDSNVTYKVLRFHEGNVDILDTTVTDGYIYFTTDKFSDYALVTVAAADTTEEETNNETEAGTESATEAGTGTTTAGSSTTSTTTSTKTADNSMMPLFMTTLLLALCAGSLAIYKEKKTN
ncbi:hypothetical protein [Lachnospira multipara]|uniref:Uncharacterized protein n=1 Tax=Lachnospira multipara TaxID=28051 RepID=A0A1H5V6R7_9FIRM|nr:hypothetical protein [Lachnospira multipara]SEF83065.1 hypothetical protein SAMN05216537_1109 [Lachnospira multipara]